MLGTTALQAQFIVPAMTHPIMGLSQLAATGISLCSLSLGTMAGAANFLMSDSVDVARAAAIALPSIESIKMQWRRNTDSPSVNTRTYHG